MNKNESKYFNTALRMDQALVSLLAEKDFEYVTVKEICARAHVNRSTFYLHYETIGDLLNESLEYFHDQFISRFPVNAEDFVPNIASAELKDLILVSDEFLMPYLSFIKENKCVYRAAFRNPASMSSRKQMETLSQHIINPIMARFRIPESERAYRTSFYIHGCVAVIGEWLDRGCADPTDDIARVIISCVMPDGQ